MRRRVRIAHAEPVARAAGQADEPSIVPLEQTHIERRWDRLGFAAGWTRVLVRRREHPRPHNHHGWDHDHGHSVRA